MTDSTICPARAPWRILLGAALFVGAFFTVSAALSLPRAFEGSTAGQNLGRLAALGYAWAVSAALIGLGAINIFSRLRGERRVLAASLVALIVGTPTVLIVWAVNCLLRC
ncbi:MAG TPA: hypothetical protein VM841_15170 [Actinomycetota bacterium]|nr:hypothetical protein [Actinomycetota bacterium]